MGDPAGAVLPDSTSPFLEPKLRAITIEIQTLGFPGS